MHRFFPPARLVALLPLGLAMAASLVAGHASRRTAGAAEPAGGELNFNRDIRPILSDNCFACHGFDAKKRQGDLRLDTLEGATAARDGRAAIKPRDLAGSVVWERIDSDDPETVMPPPSSNKRLTPAQIATLRRWIEQGAAYQKHWAFEPPAKAPEPHADNAAWNRNPIDKFLLARLRREKLQPQPEASRETLIRRVAFALTGLPPTIAEVDQFLADKSPDAYDAMVDRYLKSPRYGEEMARHWLDVARYADTHGLHLDNERQMWAYRDWVVQAFNENLPFDQFTIWQLAGDLLPQPTAAQRIATGFNRCNVTTSEGGSIAEEFLYRYAVERAATTVQTWMGLTGGCAVCHDHKYDPLSTREFYSLYAFFYSAADPAMDGNINVTAPFLKLPTAAQQAKIDAALAAENRARAMLDDLAGLAPYRDSQSDDAKPDAKTNDAKDDVKADDSKPALRLVEPRAVVDMLLDDFVPLGVTTRNTTRNATAWLDQPAFNAPSKRRVLRQANSKFHEDQLTFALRPYLLPAEAKLSVWVRLDPLDPPAALALLVNSTGGTKRAIWGRIEAFDNVSPSGVVDRGPLPAAGVWTKLELDLVAIGLGAGQTLNSISLQEAGGIVTWDALELAGKSDPKLDPLDSFAAWRKSLAGKSPADVPSDLQAALKAGPEKPLEPAKLAALQKFYLAIVARPITPELETARTDFEAARTARLAAEDEVVGTFVYQDVEKPRDAFVMLRGQYNKPGDKVEPGVPEIFPPLKKERPDARATRLDLARWLVAPEHPLTARVAVNRLWQQFFGTGLVKTSYDFGSQGEPPSHPELLDWLAVHYRESGWNTRELVRLLVTSSAFRQQTRVTPEVLQRDPENRLYARGPRFRLDAEQVRDNALAVSGLLNLEMGGRGVKGYQPPNIWEPVGYGDSNTRYYLQDHGVALYRRSLYMFLKRTAPPPFMSNFDGPNREQSCSLRERSNTPLQALQLMNDVQHYEAARTLAERVLTADVAGGKQDASKTASGDATVDRANADAKAGDARRIEFLYRTVLARRPDSVESQLVRDALAAQRKLFEADPASAEKSLKVGESAPKLVAPAVELASWTVIANLLLNLDETVTRP